MTTMIIDQFKQWQYDFNSSDKVAEVDFDHLNWQQGKSVYG